VGALLAQLGVRGGRAGGADWHRGGVRRDWTCGIAWCAVSWTTATWLHHLHQTVGYGLIIKHVFGKAREKKKGEIKRDNDG